MKPVCFKPLGDISRVLRVTAHTARRYTVNITECRHCVETEEVIS